MSPPLDGLIMMQALIHEAKYLVKPGNRIENSDLNVEVCGLGFTCCWVFFVRGTLDTKS